MKYSCEIVVEASREKCVSLWFDEKRLSEWQDGFLYKNWINGKANEVHSKAYILFEQKGRKLELEELIIDNQLPTSFKGKYTHIHMINTQEVVFTQQGMNQTVIRTDVIYTQFNSLVPKLMARFLPGMFRKQSQKWLDQFKTMVEE